MDSLGRGRLISAVLLAAVILISEASANAAPMAAPSILSYDQPLSRPINRHLIVRMPLEPTALAALVSLDRKIEAATLIASYRTAQVLPPLTRVDLCKVISAAALWIPTAKTRAVPSYVPLALALTPATRANCSGVTSGPLPLDGNKAAGLLLEFHPKIYQMASSSGPPGTKLPSRDAEVTRDAEVSSLASKAKEDEIPNGVTVDTPRAYYIKDLLAAARVNRSYPPGDPDRYLLVDMAFALRQFRPLELKQYESALLEVFTVTFAGRTVAHSLLPIGITDAAGMTTLIYVVQSDGSVRVGDKAKSRGWHREYRNVVPEISSGGTGSSVFFWDFVSRKYPLTGPRKITVILQLPPRATGQVVSLMLDLKVKVRNVLLRRLSSYRPATSLCFSVKINDKQPAVAACN